MTEFMRQEIELQGHKAWITNIWPHLAGLIWPKEDSITVWIEFENPVVSIISFGVDLPAKCYSKKELLEIVIREGEKSLAQMQAQHADEQARRCDETTRKQQMDIIVADIRKELEG